MKLLGYSEGLDALQMKMKFLDSEIPYPLSVLKGRLRLSGLTDSEVASTIAIVMNEAGRNESWREEDLLDYVEEHLEKHSSNICQNFRLLRMYDEAREKSPSLPGIILVLEGASATGKSLLALELVRDIAATRYISTDTVRQIVRGILDEHEHPELHCHTYQAHKYKQSGNQSLNPIIRGFIAQLQILEPYIEDLTNRLISEGATGLIEGVHIRPGTYLARAMNVLEVMINPSVEMHKAMFLGKHAGGKLKTVSSDILVRNTEFEATRIIQDYMLSSASEHGVPIIDLKSYESARIEISHLVIETIRNLMDNYVGGEYN